MNNLKIDVANSNIHIRTEGVDIYLTGKAYEELIEKLNVDIASLYRKVLDEKEEVLKIDNKTRLFCQAVGNLLYSNLGDNVKQINEAVNGKVLDNLITEYYG